MTDRRKKPRLLQYFWAWLRGYVWLPCPLCGGMFGGHEAAGSLLTGKYRGRAVCANCSDEADRRNLNYRQMLEFGRLRKEQRRNHGKRIHRTAR